MNVTRCDDCKKKKVVKEILKWTKIAISGPRGYQSFDFCDKCVGKFMDKILNSKPKSFKNI